MSLLTLPETWYLYVSIGKEDTNIVVGQYLDNPNSAQFWLDTELDEKRYVLASWWKFWKKTTTFKVFACGCETEPFYQTIKLQYK